MSDDTSRYLPKQTHAGSPTEPYLPPTAEASGLGSGSDPVSVVAFCPSCEEPSAAAGYRSTYALEYFRSELETPEEVASTL